MKVRLIFLNSHQISQLKMKKQNLEKKLKRCNQDKSSKTREVKEVIPSSTETVSKPDVEKTIKKDKDEDEVMADEDDVKKMKIRTSNEKD